MRFLSVQGWKRIPTEIKPIFKSPTPSWVRAHGLGLIFRGVSLKVLTVKRILANLVEYQLQAGYSQLYEGGTACISLLP